MIAGDETSIHQCDPDQTDDNQERSRLLGQVSFRMDTTFGDLDE